MTVRLTMRPLLAALSVLIPLALAACGSSGGEGDKTSPFIGTWRVTTGKLTAICPDPIGSQDQKLDDSEQSIAKGTDSDLVLTLLPGCSVKLDVTGKMANLKASNPPQTC